MGKRKLPKRVICFDTATNITGFAIGELPLEFDSDIRRDNWRLVEHGLIRTPTQANGKKLEADEKLEKLFSHLHAHVKHGGNIIRAYVERPAMHNFVASRGKSGPPRQNIKTTIQVWRAYQCAMAAAWAENVPAFDIAPATWRKTCDVKGTTRKDKKDSAVLMAKHWFHEYYDVYKGSYFPLEIKKDDEAEAICMLWHAISHCHLWRKNND